MDGSAEDGEERGTIEVRKGNEMITSAVSHERGLNHKLNETLKGRCLTVRPEVLEGAQHLFLTGSC